MLTDVLHISSLDEMSYRPHRAFADQRFIPSGKVAGVLDVSELSAEWRSVIRELRCGNSVARESEGMRVVRKRVVSEVHLRSRSRSAIQGSPYSSADDCVGGG